jgi:hypothetical protein
MRTNKKRGNRWWNELTFRGGFHLLAALLLRLIRSQLCLIPVTALLCGSSGSYRRNLRGRISRGSICNRIVAKLLLRTKYTH